MRRQIFAFLTVILMCACSPEATDVTVSVVPQPVSIQQFVGTANPDDVRTSIDTNLGVEEYFLDTRSGKVKITGGGDAGVFYGMKTLDQLKLQAVDGKIARVLINDKPQFAYRGIHYDCSRHFFDVGKVKEYIDMAAMHKLNTVHLHLTDDNGWRFESKKYPKLQEIAAWRHSQNVRFKRDPQDTVLHGGYYTQEEIKDMVAYAAERHITIVPEIEMPGHSLAALTAYPQLGCTGGPYEIATDLGVFKDILCVGKDETIKFLEDILDEVCEVFPSEYIHIGGDESPRDRWKECPACQARMKAEGLKSESELQSWLNVTIEKYLAAKGRRIIGWDEILEGGVSSNATVMSWRGTEGGKVAASQGNDVIMSPTTFYYFDYYQTSGGVKNGEPESIGGHVNLEQAFSFNPYEGLDENARKHIIGIQANLWGEYMTDWNRDAMYRVLPRVAGLAEVAWNADGRSDYGSFVERVRKVLLPQYIANGWSYADFAFRNPPVE